MAATRVDLERFLAMGQSLPVLDVRSPGEYEHAHIPNGISLPLFTNEERSIVGTAYKQESRESAIKKGLDFFGPNMRKVVEQAEQIAERYQTRQLLVHCWRGGMRSGAIAWLLDLYGFKVYTLAGGYKAYRQWALDYLAHDFPLRVIGGYTGSGKTKLLHALQQMGEAVIDLEAIAGHRGSAFGNLGLPPQPSSEQFENNLALALRTQMDFREQHNKPCIWIEGESRRIGNVNMHFRFYETMQQSPYIFLQIPFEQRLAEIVEGYGHFPAEKLINGVSRITKRMGGQHAKAAVTFIEQGNIEAAFGLLLTYYDKYYERSSFENKTQLQTMKSDSTDALKNAQSVLALYSTTIHDTGR